MCVLCMFIYSNKIKYKIEKAFSRKGGEGLGEKTLDNRVIFLYIYK